MKPGDMNRKELEAFAATHGIADPEGYPNMASLREAIEQAMGGVPPVAAPAATDDAGEPDARAGSAAGDTPLGPVPEDALRVIGLGPDNRVAFFERDGRHPGGQVFLTGGDRAIVHRTAAVIDAIRDRRLAEG